ncbi:MAG: glycoside hydrolase family 99-like domain-containing protein [Sulfuricurvum sp.]|nr:glycoside hydrolase family 99-like domain-containing protein [Sulfuricurvum sp.]
MKIIAFYLPQFHEIEENNQWWGKGFTDWTNVKKAKPLFPKHHQPNEPLNDNYYNLLDNKTMQWQANIAQQYGVYGFCYYHYWFKGKKLLEKPLDKMLLDPEITIPFCFSWANEPWTRAWDGQDEDILMYQDYGDINDWKAHFDYLLPFFLDKRYMYEQGKPIFLIYRTSNIPQLDQMLALWDMLAKQAGLKGIYLVETLSSFQNKPYATHSNAVVEFEPNFTAHDKLSFIDKVFVKLIPMVTGVSIQRYDLYWKFILNRIPTIVSNRQTIPGAFINWDNTPRKGKKGLVFLGASPKKFEKYLSLQLKRAKSVYKSSFVFINAWNEWAEGSYLEPDKKYQYQMLEALQSALAKSEK